MVFLYLLVFLCHIVSLSYMSSAVTQLICSSENVSLWCSYDGKIFLFFNYLLIYLFTQSDLPQILSYQKKDHTSWMKKAQWMFF